MSLQLASLVFQLTLYFKFERLFVTSSRLDGQTNLKYKLRLGFIPFILMVGGRTLYFFVIKALFLKDREHSVL